MGTGTRTPAKAGRREWLGLTVLALPTLLLSVDLSVLYLVLPRLSEDLHPSSTQQLWIIDIYGFMTAGFLVTMGAVGDRIGRRRLLLAGAAAFAVASTVAAFATGPAMLILARAAMGIAGATVMPSTLALIRAMFEHPRQRSIGVAVWQSCFMGGMALGPLVGGLLLGSFWWGSVFLLGVPVMVLLLVTAPFLLAEHRDDEPGRIDLLSVALSLATVLPVIYGIKELARGGPGPLTLGMLAGGLVVGVVFVQRQRTLETPLLDLRLFRTGAVRAALGVMLLSTLTMGGITFLVNQFLQLARGLSPLAAGLALLPSALGSMAGNMSAPLLARKLRPGNAIAVGLAVAAAGLALLITVDPVSGLAVLVIGYTVTFTGIGPMGVLGTDIVVGSVPARKAGSAAAIAGTNGELGVAMGVAILGSVGSAVYRADLGSHLPPGLPAPAVAAARDSLTGASTASAGLPPDLGGELLRQARDSFTAGLHVVAAIAAEAVAVYAALAALSLKNIGTGDDGSG